MKKVTYALVGLIAMAGNPWVRPGEAGDSARRVARMTLASGGSRTVTLEGVGCSDTICSRVVVLSRPKGDSRSTKTSLDAIAVIKEITADDALFVMKNGTTQRLSVVRDNRFLYFADERGAAGKIDLAGVASVEFLAPGR
jgi:hypothetical protein